MRSVVVENKINTYRLVGAILIAPSIPISLLAFISAKNTGNSAWYPVLFLFGYLLFFLVGLPIFGTVIHMRKFSTHTIAGGLVAIVPVLLLSLFSLFSSNRIIDPNMALQSVVLFLIGCLGGVVFWLIAFAEESNTPKNDHNKK
jgi:hypothetical protein